MTSNRSALHGISTFFEFIWTQFSRLILVLALVIVVSTSVVLAIFFTKSGPEWVLWQAAEKVQSQNNVTFKWQDYSRPQLDTVELKNVEFSDPFLGNVKINFLKIIFSGPFENLKSLKLGLKIPISKVDVGQIVVDRSKVIARKPTLPKNKAKDLTIPGWLDLNAELVIKGLKLIGKKNTSNLTELNFDVAAHGKKRNMDLVGQIKDVIHGNRCEVDKKNCIVHLKNVNAKLEMTDFDFKGNAQSNIEPSLITKPLKLSQQSNIVKVALNGKLNVPAKKIDFKRLKVSLPIASQLATLETHSELTWKNKPAVLIHTASLDWNGSRHLVSGSINDQINVFAKVNAISVEQLSPWIKMENLQGTVYGNIHLTGNLKYPNIESNFFVNGIKGETLLQFEGTLKGALQKMVTAQKPWQVSGKINIATVRFQTEMNASVELYQKNNNWTGVAKVDSGVVRDSTFDTEINSINLVAELVDQHLTVQGNAKVSDSQGKLSIQASGKPFLPVQQNTINIPPRMQGVIHVSDLPIDFNQILETLANSKITFVLPADSNEWKIGGIIKPRETVVNLDRSTPKLARLNVIDQRKISLSSDQYGPEIPLDYFVEAPSEKKKIFIPALLDIQLKMDRPGLIRGRGINAEFNGTLQVRGNPNNLNWVGNFDVIRGRYEWAGQRFDLSKGYVTVSNKLVSFHGEAQVAIEGTAITVVIDTKGEDIDFNLTSVPALPEEEILALLFFGGSVDSLSPLQAIRLAQAVQQMRSGKASKYDPSEMAQRWIGVDDFKVDTTTSEAGETDVTVGVGKYISRRLYLEVAKGLEATSPVEANLDAEITNNILIRGTSKSDRSFQGIKLIWQKVY